MKYQEVIIELHQLANPDKVAFKKANLALLQIIL